MQIAQHLDRLVPAAAVRSLLLPMAACIALCAPAQAAPHEAALTDLVNAYRAAPRPCGGKLRGPLPPLALAPALAQVRIEPGVFLQHALEKAGYPSANAQAIAVSGPADAQAVMARIEHQYCRALLSTQFKAMNVVRNRDDWLIVLAQPLQTVPLAEPETAEKAVLKAVNIARATTRHCGELLFPAAPALSLAPALANAALEHSRDMAQHKHFSHQGSDGGAASDRAQQAGYQWKRIGENIASGMRTPEEAVAGWLSSPGHCANLMDRRFTEMGVAYAVSDRGTVYWTQVFGIPR
jgi:uncharacterized protein YkwD